MKSELRSTGAVALVAGGIAAAFALAACCALPILLAGAGITAYWLEPAAEVGERFDAGLTIAAALALAGAVLIVIRAPKNCVPGAFCSLLWFRIGIMMLAAIGAVLLVLSKIYA